MRLCFFQWKCQKIGKNVASKPIFNPQFIKIRPFSVFLYVYIGFMIVQENLKIPPFLMTRGFDPCTPRLSVWVLTNWATWACELRMSLRLYSALISTDSYRISKFQMHSFFISFCISTCKNTQQSIMQACQKNNLSVKIVFLIIS